MTASSASEAVNVAEWRDAMSGVTPGPWYSEPVDTEGSYGSGEDTTEGFKSYVVRTETQKSYGEDAVVCDALNSGTAEVHEEFDEDGTHAWDEPGRCTMSWVARCSTEGVGTLLSEIERLRAEAERLAGLVSSSEAERYRSCGESLSRAEAAEARAASAEAVERQACIAAITEALAKTDLSAFKDVYQDGVTDGFDYAVAAIRAREARAKESEHG